MDRRMEIAEYAYKKVALYREKWRGKITDMARWNDIPCVEKKDIVFSGAKTISDEYMGKYATGKLLRTHTSGTSGIQLDTYWSKDDYLASLFPLWIERWKNAGIHPKDRVCFFNTILPENTDCLQEDNKLIISKSNMTQSRLHGIYETMQRFSPQWLLLHPSTAMLLCDLVENENLSPIASLKYIEITGEMFLRSQKERLERVFSCIVKSHYGTMEVSSIGYESEEGIYRLLESSAYLEILDDHGNPVDDGEEGNIYVTSLHNHAMPIIRYGLGDRGRIIAKDGTRCLDLCKARKNDYLYLPDGRWISPDGLLKPVELINAAEESSILQFRAIQENENHIRLQVILEEDFEKEVFVDHYVSLLDELYKENIQYEFEFREKQMFPDKLTGKLSWFESLCG